MKINKLFFAVLALPLLAIPPLFYPPEWAKAIVFKIIFSVIFVLFLPVLLERLKQKYALQNKLLWLLLAALALGFLSLIFSSDILFSLWASPHRSGGFIFFSFCILFSVALFLTAEKKDWKNFWDFSFIIGNIVALFGLIQHFNLLPNILISYGRPVSTLSNTILLAIYLLFLIFAILPFIILEKSKKRYFYIFSLLLFIWGIVITGSRAAWIGLAVGIFYFLFFYPKIPRLKIASVILIILGVFTVYYLNSQSYIPKFLEKNITFQGIRSRVSIKLLLADPRFSAWQVALNAIKEKPIFGWGPENQSVGFDKYYDPSLPYLTKEWGSWWDRAHNIFLDLAIQYGVLFLIVYLSFFGYLFWRLHKIKSIEAHAMQAVFLAYFATLFFGFDSVSTYIILFFIVGYCLFLTSPNSSENLGKNRIPVKNFKIVTTALLALLALFLWRYNLKPLFINAKINKAEQLACNEKLPAFEKLFSQKSFLDSYIRLKYAEDVKTCAEKIDPSKTLGYLQKGVDALKYVSEIRPAYTRTWLMLGSFKTILFANETSPEIKQNLFKQADSDFNKALSLGPKHQETLAEWAKLYFAAGDFTKMKQLAEKCVSLNPDTNTCYWYLGLAEIALGDSKSGEEHLQTAKAKRFPYDNQTSYSQLALVYVRTKSYQELVPIYEALISLNPKNTQYYVNLSVVYKELGDYKNARKQALKIIELVPEMKNDVDEFLNSLR